MKQSITKMKRLLRPGKTVLVATLELADAALDGVPIPGAKGAIRAVLDLIRGIDTTSRNSETLAKLEGHVQFLTELLKPLAKMGELNLPSDLEDDMGILTQDLENIVSAVKSKFSAGVVTRFLERHENEHHLTTFAQELRAALDRFQTRQIVHLGKKSHLQEQELYLHGQELYLQGQQIRLKEQESLLRERSALVTSLPRADNASYDSGREDAPLSCLEGTRVAILAEIMSWLESAKSKEPSIYWLNGLAGIGKSTIAKTTAERAHKKGMLGGSFFFSRSDRPLRDPELVFPTLAFQLAQSDHVFKNVIGEALQQDATLGHKKLLPQLEGLIFTPLCKLDSDRRTTLIVLDALDECEEGGATEILRLLFSHATRIPFLRILITSRPDPHISSVFDEAKNHAKRILHDIEASVIQQDIRLYIRHELAKIPKKLGLRMAADWATDRKIDALVEKSGKLFVYAATSIRFIGDDRVRKPGLHLNIILSTQTTQEVGVTPYAHLDTLYMDVLRNSLSKSNRRDVIKDFQVVVGSIVLLRETLPLHSLAQFVGYKMDDVDTALYHLRSVIIQPSNDREAPRIYHPSFRDFIMDDSRCSEVDFLIVPVPEQERRHAVRCFDLMATFLKRDVAGISDPSLLNSEVDGFNQKVRDALSPEVQYACRYWASHLSCVEFGDKAIVEALEAFSMGSILVWLEAMSLIGSISNSASLIREAHQWAMSSKCESTVVTILSDTNRFILAYAEAIRVSALHVYHSALAFTPHDTALYKTYSQDTSHPISVLQGVESQWQRNLSTLVGHSDSVSSVAFSPDGLRLASGSDDHTLRLWDGMSGAHITTLKGHSDRVTLVAFSPDGLRLASGSLDGTLRLWDGMSGTHIATLEGHSHLVSSVAFSPNGLRLVSGSDDSTLRLRDGMSGAHIATLEGHSHLIASVTFSPDSLRLASGSRDGTIRLWDGMLGTHIATLEGHSRLVTSVAFSPNGLRLASGSDDSTIRLWNGTSGAHIATLEGHSRLVASVAFSPDGLRLASGSRDGTLQLWNGVSGVHIVERDSKPVTLVAFLPDGSQIVSCSHDGTLQLWGGVQGEHIATLRGHSDWVTSIAFSPDSLRFASGSRDGTLRLWKGTPDAHIATLEGHSRLVTSIAFSPNGLRLASGSHDHALWLWDAISGVHIATLRGHSDCVTSVVFSPDSLRLVSGSDDCTLWLWDGMSGAHITVLEGHSHSITLVAFLPDGLRLASGSRDHTLRLWDSISGMHIATLKGHSDWVTSVALLPDGLRLASGSRDRTLRLWDGVSGAQIATLRGHIDWVTSVAFSPDGLQLASGSDDGTLRLWDGTSGAHIATLKGHSGSVTSVAFSIDSHTLISQAHVETFTWDLTSSPPCRLDPGSLAVAFPPTTDLSSLAWSADGPWVQVQHPRDNHITRICYIPTLYAPSTTVQVSSLPTQSQVAIGCVDGRVIILDVHRHPFVHRLRQVATT